MFPFPVLTNLFSPTAFKEWAGTGKHLYSIAWWHWLLWTSFSAVKLGEQRDADNPSMAPKMLQPSSEGQMRSWHPEFGQRISTEPATTLRRPFPGFVLVGTADGISFNLISSKKATNSLAQVIRERWILGGSILLCAYWVLLIMH